MLEESGKIIKGPLVFEPFYFSNTFRMNLLKMTRPSAIRKLFSYSNIIPITICRNDGSALFYMFYSGVSAVEYASIPSANCHEKCNNTCLDKEDVYLLVEDTLDFIIAKFYSKHHVLRWINASSVDEIVRYKYTVPNWLRCNTRRSSRKKQRTCLRSAHHGVQAVPQP